MMMSKSFALDVEKGLASQGMRSVSLRVSPHCMEALIASHWQAEVGLGERGFRGMLRYLIRFR